MPFLTRPSVLTVLLEYTNLSGNVKQTFRKGYPALYYSILLYFILSIGIVAKCILLEFVPITHAIILLLLSKFIVAKLVHP